MASKATTIGLFGASLNPPTYIGGHFSIVQYFSKIFGEVWVLPVYKHTFASKRDLPPFRLRCELASSTFQELPNVHVKQYEKDGMDAYMAQPPAQRGGEYGTIDLLRYLRKTFPDQTFAWILGADSYNDILAGKWDRGMEIFQVPGIEFAIVERHGYALTRTDVAKHVKIYSDVPVGKVSSSMVRQCADPEKLAKMVHPEVAKRIVKENLYAFEQEAPRRANQAEGQIRQ